MYQLKYLPVICGLIIIGTIIEILRQRNGIPITLLDVMLFPIALLFSVVFLRHEFFNKKNLFRYNLAGPVSIPKKIGIFIGCMLMAVSGIWCLWLGICDPLAYYSGVRGAVHGYTMVAFGLFLFLLGAYGVLKSILINLPKPQGK